MNTAGQRCYNKSMQEHTTYRRQQQNAAPVKGRQARVLFVGWAMIHNIPSSAENNTYTMHKACVVAVHTAMWWNLGTFFTLESVDKQWPHFYSQNTVYMDPSANIFVSKWQVKKKNFCLPLDTWLSSSNERENNDLEYLNMLNSQYNPDWTEH